MTVDRRGVGPQGGSYRVPKPEPVAEGGSPGAPSAWTPAVGQKVRCQDQDNVGTVTEVDSKGRRAKVHWVGENGQAEKWKPISILRPVADPSGGSAGFQPRAARPFRPFPTAALPAPLDEYVPEQAAALGVDEAYVAAPLLATLAAAIGSSRILRIKKDWTVPSILWVMLVAESGGMKSPVLKAVTRWIRKEEERLADVHDRERERHRTKKAAYDREFKAWKGAGTKSRGKKAESPRTDDPPVPPEPPHRERRIVEDATVEAIAPILKNSPRGLLLHRDEASGWLDSLNEYKKRGGDTARWNAMYDGGTLSVDRKGGDAPSILVRRACVSILGGIQPGVLARRMTEDAVESGLFARCLLTMPPRSVKAWNDREVGEGLLRRMAETFRSLFGLGMTQDEAGHTSPIELTFTAKGRELWKEHVDRHGETGATLTGADASWWAKLEGVAARLALILALVRDPKTRTVGEEDVQAGIAIADWWADEIDRVRALLTEDEAARRTKALVELIRRKGGRAEPRDLVAWCRWIKSAPKPAELARSVLRGLAKERLGTIEELPSKRRGAPPKMVFVLFEAVSKSATSAETGLDAPDPDGSPCPATDGARSSAPANGTEELLTSVSSSGSPEDGGACPPAEPAPKNSGGEDADDRV
ncbi:MAG: DUF3987 domain-containing protein [Planctomycetota bacterium JB042]